jgi:hypothetical protein
MPNTHLFVHIGDAHLAPGPRNADRRRAIDQIIAECATLPNLAAWLWPGDLFHGPRTSDVDDRNWLDTRLQQMAAIAPVVICYGNHDPAGDLDGFARLNGTHPIYVIDRPHVLRLRVATGVMASIFVLPYPTRAGLVAAGLSSGDVVDVGREALEAIFRQAGDPLEMARTMNDLTLMIGHVNVAGAITSSGQPNIGREIEIDGRMLDLLGDCYKGLNHIHKAQLTDGHAFYAGSICRLDWGEIEEKTYNVVTYAAPGVLNEPWNRAGAWEFDIASPSIRVAPMFHVEGRLTREGLVDVVVTAGPGGEQQEMPATWDGCEVRLRYRYAKSEAGVVDHAVARAPFAAAGRLHLDPVAVIDRDIRAPQVAAAKTLDEKVVAYLETDGKTASLGAMAKLSALQQQDGFAVLADVQALVARVSSVPVTVQFEEALY